MKSYKVTIEIRLEDGAGTDWIADAIGINLDRDETFSIDIEEIKEVI